MVLFSKIINHKKSFGWFIKSDKFKSSEIKKTETQKVTQKNIAVQKKYKIYTNLQKLLNSIGLGETKTKQQLIDSKVVPDDALQIVKSVTKVSENEQIISQGRNWIHDYSCHANFHTVN